MLNDIPPGILQILSRGRVRCQDGFQKKMPPLFLMENQISPLNFKNENVWNTLKRIVISYYRSYYWSGGLYSVLGVKTDFIQIMENWKRVSLFIDKEYKCIIKFQQHKYLAHPKVNCNSFIFFHSFIYWPILIPGKHGKYITYI